MRQTADSRRRYPAGLAFVCRCSKWSVRWQLILFWPSVNMSWQPHALSCIFWAVLVPGSPQPRGFFLPGKEGGVTFWPQGTASVLPSPDLHFKTSFTTQRWRSKCRILKCCSDLCLALHRHSSRRAEVTATCISDQAWAVDVKISYWVRYPHATSPNLSACSGLQSASFVFVLWFIICCYRSWWGSSFHSYLSVLNFLRCWNTEDLIIRSHPKWWTFWSFKW